MRHRFGARAAIIVAMGFAWHECPADAPSAASLAGGLRACAAETDDARRLACFDALVQRVPAMEKHAFGLPAMRERAAEAAPREPATLVAHVTRFTLQADNRLLITLDNGQTWAQVSPDARFATTVGEEVTIEKAALGSYFLTAGGHRATRVRRIR